VIDPLAESGRGLQLVAAVVDDLDVITIDGVGTLLRFVKQLSWATP
jgi:anti-sigma regulatory factor (Ser/Thr protein kinase)